VDISLKKKAKERMDEEKTSLVPELKKALRLPGAGFTSALLMAIILPALGVISQAFGAYVAGIFVVSGMVAYPLSAIISRAMHERIKFKGDIMLILLFSLIMSLYSYWPNILTALIKYLIALPIAVFTLWLYMKFHDMIRTEEIEEWRQPFQEILKATIPTIITVVAIVYSLKLFIGTFNIQEKAITILEQAIGG